MRSFSAATVAAGLAGVATAFDANAKTNVVTYWGQGAGQESLMSYCENPNVDIINIGFVNVFPDQGKAGWPGTNFGNACGSETYTHNNISTQLLSNCPDIGPDIEICQKIYGTKILLSIGGATANGFNVDTDSAKNFANFLWGSFGPVLPEWTSAGGPRPFGDAVVDGFDFDIESELSSPPTVKGQTITDYKTRGWAAMVNTLRSLFAQDTTKTYYLSAAPQCVVPDAHLSTVVANAWFDFLFVQFYNTAECSARSALSNVKRATGFGGYDNWASVSSYNPNVKIYLGLAASKDSAADASYYLEPSEVQKLVNAIYGTSKFGGIMLWQASTAENNVICNRDYATWMKQILDPKAAGTTLNTKTSPCPAQPISKEGLCGGYNGQTCVGSIFGSCCSQYGYCGDTADYCSTAKCDPTGGECGDEYVGVISSPESANSTSSASVNTTTIASSTSVMSGTAISAGFPKTTGGSYTNGTGNLADALANQNVVSTKTIYSTEVFTVTSCAPEVTDCPLRPESQTLIVQTSTYAVSTALITGGAFAATSPAADDVDSTKTVYSTKVFTITSCAPEVTDCPLRPESQTVVVQTSTYATVVTGAAFASSSSSLDSASTSTSTTTVSATSTVYKTVVVSSSTASAESETIYSSAASSSTMIFSSVSVAINAAPYALSNSTSTYSYPPAGTISSTIVQLVTATIAPVQVAQVSHASSFVSSGVASSTLAYHSNATSTLPAMAYFTGAANRAEYGMGAVALAVGALLAL